MTLRPSTEAWIQGLWNSRMYLAIPSGLSRNLFLTACMAITIFSSSASGRSLRISFCERVQASRYEVCAFTTAGTSSTMSAPQSLALWREVRFPAWLFSTTAGSPEDNGYFQWSIFMTESMRTLAASAALFISSAFCPSGSVGDCTTSKPTSRAILKRSATESVAGNMLKTKPFLMDRLAGPAAGTAADVGAAARSSAAALPPRAAEQAAVTDDFRNLRRDERSIFIPRSTALALSQRAQI